MRMVEVVYSEFWRQLEVAAESGGRIEHTDKQRWKAYVRENNVKEAASRVHAGALGEPIKAVIISNGGDWDGYYVYSASDEICLRYSRE